MEGNAKADGFDMTWLISQALMNSLCLQGQEGEFLEDTSLDGEPSAPLSGNSTQQAYCAPDKMTKFSRLSRFGMTYKPLTEDLGQELLTLYLADFHAKTLVPQEKVQELQAADPQCGSIWLASLAKYDHNTSMWKTAQCSLLEDSMSFSLTLPRWGLMQDGALYPQQTLVQTIKENESGLWPTPNTLEGLAPKKLDRIMEYNNKSRPGRSYASMNLREQVVYGKIPIWPTPQARDHKGNSGRSNKGQELDLPTKVKMLPTPTSSEHKYRLQGESQASKCLEAQARRGELEEGSGGTLNPNWVEWLMGWPPGWSDLKPLEMDKFQKWQEQHGSYLNE
jgi:hypothetical protein